MNKTVSNKKVDLSPAQIIALLHDKKITLASIARKNGLADATGLSAALSRSFPVNEKRIADALKLHPMALWPTRYNSDGSRIEQGYKYKQK